MRSLRDWTRSWVVLSTVGLLAVLALAACDRGSDTTGAGAEEPQAAVEQELTTPGEEAAALAEQKEELEAREAELAQREAELAEQEAETVRERKGAELARKEAELRRREAELAARERAADEPVPSRQPALTEPAPEEETPALAEAAPEPDAVEPEAVEPRRETVALTVPAGTLLEIEFLDTVGSAESASGDDFRARVSRDVVVDGLVAVPAGSQILGTVVEAVPLKKVGGKARLALDFRRLELPSGESVALAASFAEMGKSETKRDAATIGGAAAGGAVLGRILAGDKDKKKGTVLGAIIGAAAGTAIASRTEGEEVTIPRGTVLELRLDEWVRVMAER